VRRLVMKIARGCLLCQMLLLWEN